MYKRSPVPALAFVVVLGLALLLIAGIIVRPWQMVSGGSKVDVLDAQAPSGYSRSPVDYVGSNLDVGFDPQPAAGDTSANAGKAYFVEYGCVSCHGIDGKGTSYAPMSISSAATVLAMVRSGPGGMPVYPKDYLPDDTVKAIAAWLLAQQPPTTSIPTPTPTTAATTPPTTTTAATPPATTTTATQPAGDLVHGASVFSGSLGCSACHGQNAAGGFGPALNNAQFAQGYPTDASLAAIIRDGKDTMPAFDTSRLSDADLADLIAYIRSLQK